MKPKQMMLFAVAIGCGLVAMFGAQQILSGNKPAEQEMVKILIAKVDIDPGVPLDKANIAFKDWPKDNVPEGAITSEEQFADHALKIRVSPNMPVLIPYLGPKGVVGVGSLIPKGMNLVTLPVDLTQTHSGLLRPGSYVTISCAIEKPRGDGRTNTTIKTVLKRVKVVAVGDRLAGTEVATKEGNAPEAKNISFVTYPRQAKLLYLAKQVSDGKMQYAMLGEADNSTDDAQDLDEDAFAQKSNELFGERAPQPQDNILAAANPVAKTRPTGSSFSDYLKQQPVAPEVVDLGKRPAKTTWQIVIFNGDKKEIQELELPDEVSESPAIPPSTTELWTSPLMQFFSRKRTKSAVQESKATPSEEIRTDSSSDKSAATPVDTTRQ